jgi:hypothetical protein
LREKHTRMAKSGERPPFLEEYYTSHRNLYREAKRLEGLGYRVRSRQDMRDANGYRVTFAYVGASVRNEPVPVGGGVRGRS